MRKMLILILVGIGVTLASCKQEEEPLPPPQPDTPVVQEQQQQSQPTSAPAATPTPRRQEGPTPLPPLPFDIAPYAAEWTLLLRYEIAGHALVDNAVYSLSGRVNIGFDGLVSGFGTFSSTLALAQCVVQPVDITGLTVSITGAPRQVGEDIVVDLQLTPLDMEFVEQYKTVCYDRLDGSETEGEFSGSILFPIMQAARQFNLTFTLTTYADRQVFELDLAEATSNQIQGTLSAEMYLGR